MNVIASMWHWLFLFSSVHPLGVHKYESLFNPRLRGRFRAWIIADNACLRFVARLLKGKTYFSFVFFKAAAYCFSSAFPRSAFRNATKETPEIITLPDNEWNHPFITPPFSSSGLPASFPLTCLCLYFAKNSLKKTTFFLINPHIY